MISLISESKARRRLSSESSAVEEVTDNQDDRKERQLSGHIKFSTYKAYFKAAHNTACVLGVFIVFVVAELLWNGADIFLSFW